MPKVVDEQTRELTRRRILQEAAREFARLGFDQANINVIAEQAGIGNGTLTLAMIQQVPLEDRAARTVEEVMQRDVLIITPNETLDETLEQLSSRRVNWALVLDLDHEGVTGVISTTQIMRAYRQTLAKDARCMRGLTTGTIMLEVEIRPEMPLARISESGPDFIH